MSRMLVWVSTVGLVLLLWVITGCGGSDKSSVDYALSLEPNGLTLKAGQELQLSPTVLANGSPVTNPRVTWSTSGTIGTISNTGLLKATTVTSTDAPQTGTVEVNGYGKTVSIPVTVIVGDLAKIEIISPDGVNLNQVAGGTTLTFTAVGEDAYGNRGQSRIAVTPTWSVQGNIGTISATGEFQARQAGTGSIIAKVGDLQASVNMTVVAGTTCGLMIVPPEGVDVNNLSIGQQVAFTAVAVDSGNNSTGDPLTNVEWSVQGGVGAINQQGLFVATKVGSGKVVAVSGALRGELSVTVTGLIPQGKIAFVKWEGMYANIAMLTTTSPVKMISQGNNHYDQPDWSRDGAKLVVKSVLAATNGICVMNPLTGAAQSIYASQGQDPAWSPDGSTIALANGEVGAGEIIFIDVAGNYLRKVAVSALGTPSDPTWSPNGAKIAFCINSTSGLTNGVYIMNADGTGSPQRIYSGSVNHVEWSGNANLLAAANDCELFTLSTSGATELIAREANQIEGGLAWSPDNKAIAYAVRDGYAQLHMVILGYEQIFQLTSFTNASATDPTWTN